MQKLVLQNMGLARVMFDQTEAHVFLEHGVDTLFETMQDERLQELIRGIAALKQKTCRNCKRGGADGPGKLCEWLQYAQQAHKCPGFDRDMSIIPATKDFFSIIEGHFCEIRFPGGKKMVGIPVGLDNDTGLTVDFGDATMVLPFDSGIEVERVD